MAIVWPCPLPVDAYVAAGREVEVPRPVCPSCAGPLVFWSGYWRHVRAAGRFALTAITAAFAAAADLPGWVRLGVWRFAASVSGGRLIAPNTGSPFLVAGRRRFMPPVPSVPA